MKRTLSIILVYFFITFQCWSQQTIGINKTTGTPDSTIYTFKVKLDDFSISQLQNSHNLPITLKYTVLESNYKRPIHSVSLVHHRPMPYLLRKGSIYTIKGYVFFKETVRPYGFSSTDITPFINQVYFKKLK